MAIDHLVPSAGEFHTGATSSTSKEPTRPRTFGKSLEDAGKFPDNGPSPTVSTANGAHSYALRTFDSGSPTRNEDFATDATGDVEAVLDLSRVQNAIPDRDDAQAVHERDDIISWHSTSSLPSPETRRVLAPNGSSGNQKRPPRERLYHLDFGRIVCVTCVVVEHCGGEIYSAHNVGFVLHWVLPFLYFISGYCYGLSRAGLVH